MTERIRTLIVDDEPMSLAQLRVRVKEDADLELVGECTDGAAAVQAIRELKPELVLLDVQMPLLDGFEVLSQVDGDTAPVVVFVTAFDEYAVRAFEVAAADFLLKPFDATRFAIAIGRGKENVLRGRMAGSEPGSSSLAPLGGRGDRRQSPYAERLLVRERGRIYLVPVTSIAWIHSAGNYVKIFTRSRTHLIRMKISDIEDMLDPSMFARVHRTKIVNLYRIASMRPVVNGNYIITLKDGTEMRMSRMHAANVFGTAAGPAPGALQ